MVASILYVDDDPDTGRDVIAASKIDFRPIDSFDGLTVGKILQEIEKVHVVLMDYDLYEKGHSEYLDGLELLERFRAAIRRAGDKDKRVPALALLTGKSQQIAEQFNCPQVEPFLSRLTNVDWIFPKGVSQLRYANNISAQISSFFNAAFAVHQEWGNENALDPQLREMLKLNEDDISGWVDEAFEEFRASRPPLQELIKRKDGNELLRWLLHIALPFPSCFVDLDWIAIKLGIQVDALRTHLKGVESKLAYELELRGILGLPSKCLSHDIGKRELTNLLGQFPVEKILIGMVFDAGYKIWPAELHFPYLI